MSEQSQNAEDGLGDGEAGAAGNDWRAGIEDDRLRGFAARFANPAEAVKSAFELRQKLSTALTPPGPDAEPTEVARFRRRLGVPDSPADYRVPLPDGLPESLLPDEAAQVQTTSFLEAIHRAGASQAVAEAAVGWYYGHLAEGLAQQTRREAEARTAAVAELRRDWGGEPAFARNATLARRAAASFGGADFARLLEEARVGGGPLGDHPALLRAFAAVGQAMAEDALLLGDGEPSGDTDTRLAELTRGIHDAAAAGDRARVAQLSRERESLSDHAYGTDPIVGDEGRAV